MATPPSHPPAGAPDAPPPRDQPTTPDTRDAPAAPEAPVAHDAPAARPDRTSAGMEVVRTHLEHPLDGLAPAAPLPDRAATLVRRTPCTVAEYRALYAGVGARWRWHDRDAWSDARLGAWLVRPDVAVWVLEHPDVPARQGGYYELARVAPADGLSPGTPPDAPGDTWELVYFGLVPALHGRGLGRAMLEHALHAARAAGAARLILNTCTLDGPAALPNYRARGFRAVREERYVVPPARDGIPG